MKNISIVFSKHTSFNIFSSLIMFGLKTPFSHCSIKMTDGDTDQIVYYQASGLSVNCVSEAEFLIKETIIYQKNVVVSDAIFKSGKTFAINQLGKPYYIMAIFGFAIQILCGMVHLHVKNPFKMDGSEYVCSQFAAAFIDTADNITLDVREMQPSVLYQAMPSLPDNWS